MIDWLYQELDEATTATFKEHVDGCAHCEGELASLQRTRAAVKALPDVEPPLAVSNILLHEAAKRAPAVKGGLDQRDGFFARLAAWFGPVLRHPGLAAAACLVLVAGVAGSLYMQGKGGFASPSADSNAPAPAAHASAGDRLEEARPTTKSAREEQTDDGEADNTDNAARAEGAMARKAEQEKAEEPATDSDRLARLGDDQKELKKVRKQITTLKAQSARKGKLALRDEDADDSAPGAGASGGSSKNGYGDMAKNKDVNADPSDVKLDRNNEQATKRWARNRIGKKAPPRRSRNAPVRRTRTTSKASKTIVTNAVTGADKLVHKRPARVTGGVLSNDVARGNGKRVRKPASTSPAPPPPPVPANKKWNFDSKRRTAPTTTSTKTPSREIAQTRAAKPKPIVQPTYRVYKVSPRVQIWTETQHVKLNSAVGRKKCLNAAKIANDILDRNPNYYYRRVGPTKQVKTCRWYVNKEWNRRAKSRSRRAKARRPKRSQKAGGVPAKAKAKSRPDASLK